MTCASPACPRIAAPDPPGRTVALAAPARIAPTAAFYLLASLTVTFLAASAAPTPLYPVYQAEWGFSPITVTIVFGVYAIAVLSALLVVGKLSDHVGRRPVLIAAVALQATTMLVFATAHGVTELIIARIAQGLSTGAAVAAVGAGLLDLDRTRGTLANAVAPMVGTASGGIVAGLMVQYLPAPTHLVYLVLGVILVLQGIGVAMMEESSTTRPGAIASLMPHFRIPAAVREPLLLAIPALIATWALAGFYASLGPGLVRSMFQSHELLVGGLALFALAGSGSISVVLLRHHEPRTMLVIGTSALFVGVGVAVAALTYRAPWAFFAGTILAGAGFGAGFQGAVRTIVPLAAPHERAGVLSVVFVVSYLAMGLPAVIAGYLVVHGGGAFTTAQEFGAVVMALAALALTGTLTRSYRPR